MRCWRSPVAALCLAVLPAGAAWAGVFAHGLRAEAHGGTIVTASPIQGRMKLSNLSDLGDAFVDISLLRATGHVVTYEPDLSSSPSGARHSFTWSVASDDASVGAKSAVLDVTASPGGLRVACDLSSLCSAPTMTQLLYLHGVLVSTEAVSPSSSLELINPTPTTLVSIILQSQIEIDHSHHHVAVSLSSPSSFVYVFGGVSAAVDQVVYVVDTIANTTGFVDLCRIRDTSPPGSPPSSLDITGQSCVRAGHLLTTTGQLHFGSLDGLHFDNISPGGLDGVRVASPLFRSLCSDGTCSSFGMLSFEDLWPNTGDVDLVMPSSSPFVLDPSDEGASMLYRVSGSSPCSPAGSVLASLETGMHLGQCTIRSHFSGMCADQESVVVLNKGVVVARVPLAVDGSVVVSAPPGAPVGMAISTKGVAATCNKCGSGTGLTPPEPGKPPRLPATSSVLSSVGLTLEVSFADLRTFCVSGTCSDGDAIQVTGRNVSGGVGAVVNPSDGRFVFRSSSVTGGGSAVDVQAIRDAGIDQVFADMTPRSGLSTAHPTLEIPVRIARADRTPIRGYSVTFHNSPNLVLAGPVIEADYLSHSGQTQFFVTHNADGSTTVDCAILGPGCGPTGDGTLFSILVSAVVPPAMGLGTVTLDAVELAGCSAEPLSSSPGGTAYVPIDFVAPNPVTGLTATQQLTGNDHDGTTKIVVTVTPVDADATVELYRAAFGNYPYYDNPPNAGSVPSIPSYPPDPSRWSQVQGGWAQDVQVCRDELAARDFYYYVAFLRDRFGNLSTVSNMTSGTLNSHLGDVSDGLTLCTGDNLVSTQDISELGFHYGSLVSFPSSFACLDVGPTSTGTVSGRPLTDGRIDFKDFIIFAINYSLVSMPAMAARPVAAAANALRLRVPPLPGAGQTFDVAVEMSGAGDAQGLSAQLAFDPAVVEPVAVTQGELLSRQGREGLVLSSQPGDVDAALLGVGAGLAGEGDLARVTFRVKAQGDPGLGIASAEARDAQNRVIALSGVGIPGATPGRTALRMAFPNPFDNSTTVVFSLSQSGPASVRVFDVAGRTVRTLMNGVQPAGEQLLAWDGRDDSGARLGAGVYMLRLESAGHRETRTVRLVK